jgi:predicted esterase
MKSGYPDPYVVYQKGQHTQTFILLHGRGSNGETFGAELLATGMSSSDQNLQGAFSGAKFIFPTAKKRRSTTHNRAMINQWFDIVSLDDPSYKKELQFSGLAESAQYIQDIVYTEMIAVGANRIILGGLSQGCAMALSL